MAQLNHETTDSLSYYIRPLGQKKIYVCFKFPDPT